MEKSCKRQWMQSFDGKIRVGPNYQAMIPPFCRTVVVPKKDGQASPLPGEGSPLYGVTPRDNVKTGDHTIMKMLDKDPASIGKPHAPCLAADDFLISR